MEATANVVDVHFPKITRISPVTASTNQRVVIESPDFNGSEPDITVGGVHVSQSPVLRTVLINTTSDELWEVEFDEGSEVTAWEAHLSAHFWNSSVALSHKESKTLAARRAKKGDTSCTRARARTHARTHP